MSLGRPVGSAFDELAVHYDRFRTGYAPELYETLFEYGLATGARVLDVGSGTGLVAAELTARGCTVVGVDVSEPMLDRARQRVPSAVFTLARAEALPFAANAFDAATSAQAFHWFDRAAALAELRRVVRPGGVVAIWWKTLMRGDTVRYLRDRAAAAAGLEPIPDLLSDGFDDFERSGLADQRLRVIPWLLETTVGEFLGYERSRARPGAAYGARKDEYFENLSQQLGDPSGALSLSYVHLLYLGRVPEPV
jgi:SAM-dependent methyltransferase